MIPPIDVPCPPMYLVADVAKISARNQRTYYADPDGIVYNEGDAGIVGNFCQGFEIGDIELGIADCFRIDGAGVTVYCLLKTFQILRIDKFCGPPQFRKV